MYVFDDSLRYTIYSLNGTFGGIEDAIPGPDPYTLSNDMISIDLSFGNQFNAMLNFKCGCNVVEVISDDTIWVWWREGYDVQSCRE